MDIRKYCNCSRRTRSIIIAYICIFIYTIFLAICGYLQYEIKRGDLILIPLLIALPLMLILITLLLYGVYKQRPNFMLPWLVVKFLSLVVLSIFLLYFCGKVVVLYIKRKETTLIPPFFITLVFVGFSWFSHAIIYTYYKSLTEDEVTHEQSKITVCRD